MCAAEFELFPAGCISHYEPNAGWWSPALAVCGDYPARCTGTTVPVVTHGWVRKLKVKLIKLIETINLVGCCGRRKTHRKRGWLGMSFFVLLWFKCFTLLVPRSIAYSCSIHKLLRAMGGDDGKCGKNVNSRMMTNDPQEWLSECFPIFIFLSFHIPNARMWRWESEK